MDNKMEIRQDNSHINSPLTKKINFLDCLLENNALMSEQKGMW